MKLTVLGCSGGIGGEQLRTTALLVDHDVLIDAGTGVADLALADLARIDHVFLTHAHLDHICCLPLMIDAVADLRSTPLVVHGIPEVLDALRRHIFNDLIWPDFTRIPAADAPRLRFQSIQLLQRVDLSGRSFSALPVGHSVPAVGYQVDSGAGSLVFSGDTGPSEAFFQAVNAIDNLKHLIIECAFPDAEADLAARSGHLCPSMLAHALRKFEPACMIHVSHLKPGQMEMTMTEIECCLGQFAPRMLQGGQVIEW